MSISHSIFIRSAFFITLLILTTTQAHAHSTLDYLNSNAKIRKDIEKKLSENLGPHLTKYKYNKNFDYCDLKNGALECQGENIFCIILPSHNGDYNLKYEVYGCNWIKYPNDYYKEIEKDSKMSQTHVVASSKGKTKWITKEEYYQKHPEALYHSDLRVHAWGSSKNKKGEDEMSPHECYVIKGETGTRLISAEELEAILKYNRTVEKCTPEMIEEIKNSPLPYDSEYLKYYVKPQ